MELATTAKPVGEALGTLEPTEIPVTTTTTSTTTTTTTEAPTEPPTTTEQVSRISHSLPVRRRAQQATGSQSHNRPITYRRLRR